MISNRGAGQRAQLPVPTRRTALIIWGALVAGLTMFGVIGTVMGPEVRRNGAAPEVLVWVALGLTAVTFLLSRVLPGKLRAPPGVTPDAMATTRTIVTAALNEGAALFAIIVWMIGGYVVVLVPLAVSVVGLLLAFPSETRWQALTADPGQPRRSPMVR